MTGRRNSLFFQDQEAELEQKSNRKLRKNINTSKVILVIIHVRLHVATTTRLQAHSNSTS